MLSVYVLPYQVVQTSNIYYNGFTWIIAHYLASIAYENFLLTSSDGSVSLSLTQELFLVLKQKIGCSTIEKKSQLLYFFRKYKSFFVFSPEIRRNINKDGYSI